MESRKNIKKVLVIGSGPIVIGQAAEFDYSGTQACESLREEGVEVVLVNSNPATIMTDREVADKVYIEPLTVEVIEKIIAKERPDALIAGMGGQTGLNLSIELYDSGILEKYGVDIIGTSIPSIKRGEDREEFRQLMEKIGEPIIESKTVETVEDAVAYAKHIGYPVVVRPAFTLGGTGGGICETEEELHTIAHAGIHLSRVGQVLIEKCITGWKEIEYEVIRDSKGTCICVCNMENIDPVGVHTGDSIVVAPTQTLTDVEHGMLRDAAFRIIEEVGIEGGCNVQFAVEPNSLQYAVIEINPRVSRSSALASKATGYPIARVAAKIALGLGLDEIENKVTGTPSMAFEPSIDYVVVKLPKWPFDKFFNADRNLGTKMMATGEVMAIGSTFEVALLKGLRSLEIGAFSLLHPRFRNMDIATLKENVKRPNDERLFYLAALLNTGYDISRLSRETGMDAYILRIIKHIVNVEAELESMKKEDLNEDKLREMKQMGFSDEIIASRLNVSENFVRELRKLFGIHARYRKVDTQGGLADARVNYLYSVYEGEDESPVTKDKKRIIVIGSGPIRIGQGVEFDYASVHCVKTLRKEGYETIIINNNPETVSTDFDISDKLYFEPLTAEDTLNIIEKENPDGVILQFGGQTAIKLAGIFKEKGVPILGTDPTAIDRAEDREKFDQMLEELHLRRPKGIGVHGVEEGMEGAKSIGYPVLVRPSYVLGGQGMEICMNDDDLRYYLEESFAMEPKRTVLIDQYIEGMECEVDAISDGTDVYLPGVMEHLERAGVHSGDSISIYPSRNISPKMEEEILDATKKVALALDVIGMINIQYIIKDETLYMIEVNPRSSRTVPYLSKVTGTNITELATKVMLGKSLESMGYSTGIGKLSKLTCVKIPVFSTEKLHRVEASLGPEMRSTGEVLGVGATEEEAMAKGFMAAGTDITKRMRNVLCTIRDRDKEEFLPIAKNLEAVGVRFLATKGTKSFLEANGIAAEEVRRIGEESPTMIDLIQEGEIDMVFNTPTKGNDSKRDGFLIRRNAIECDVELFTNLDKAKVYVETLQNNPLEDDVTIYELDDYSEEA